MNYMRTFFSTLILFLITASAHADSVDVYKVSFRGQQIATYAGPQVIHIILQADSITPFDTLKVDVQQGSPCKKCNDYSLIVFGSKGPMLIDSAQNTASFYIPLKPLVEYRRQNGVKQFHGYYTEYREGGRARVVTFKISME
jgi:hypothetical protein